MNNGIVAVKVVNAGFSSVLAEPTARFYGIPAEGEEVALKTDKGGYADFKVVKVRRYHMGNVVNPDAQRVAEITVELVPEEKHPSSQGRYAGAEAPDDFSGHLRPIREVPCPAFVMCRTGNGNAWFKGVKVASNDLFSVVVLLHSFQVIRLGNEERVTQVAS